MATVQRSLLGDDVIVDAGEHDPSFNISGHVDARGRVNVSVSAGGERASGNGELSGDSGRGLWIGHSATSACSGHWEAERRG